ncbi:MAG: hypothetical protein ACOCQD_03425 [archaeon]
MPISDQNSQLEENQQSDRGDQSFEESSILGIGMIIVGGILFLLMIFIEYINKILTLISLLMVALGIYMLISGIFGYFFKQRNVNKKRNYTKEGIASLIVLLIGIIVLSNSYSSFSGLNMLTIIFGYYGIRKGDKTVAIGGVAGGLLMFVFVAVFTYFIGSPSGFLVNF